MPEQLHGAMKKMWKILLFPCFCCGLLFAVPFRTAAQVVYTNPDTGYRVIIEDDAGLISKQEEEALAEEMKEITVYGSVAFKTVEENFLTTERYSRSYYEETFGSGSGTVFLIDMDNRNIWIHSNGKIYRTVTGSYADTITDNCYTYASKGEYYKCASKAFSQIAALLRGQRIARPMKYISNALLAAALALLLNYCLLKQSVRVRDMEKGELLKGMKSHYALKNQEAFFSHTNKYYSPQSSDSGSGGSSGGGGGSSGSSGGGGGHSF